MGPDGQDAVARAPGPLLEGHGAILGNRRRWIQTGLDAAFPENRDISLEVAPTGHFSGTALDGTQIRFSVYTALTNASGNHAHRGPSRTVPESCYACLRRVALLRWI